MKYKFSIFARKITAAVRSSSWFFPLVQLGPLMSQLMPVVEASPVSSMAKGAAGRNFHNFVSFSISVLKSVSKARVVRGDQKTLDCFLPIWIKVRVWMRLICKEWPKGWRYYEWFTLIRRLICKTFGFTQNLFGCTQVLGPKSGHMTILSILVLILFIPFLNIQWRCLESTAWYSRSSDAWLWSWS